VQFLTNRHKFYKVNALVSQWAKRELGSWVAKTVKRLLFYLSFYNLLFFTYLLYILLIYYTIISLS